MSHSDPWVWVITITFSLTALLSIWCFIYIKYFYKPVIHIKTLHEVGMAIVTIRDIDNDEFTVNVPGRALWWGITECYPTGYHITPAPSMFDRWCKQFSEKNLVPITDCHFIPLCNVKNIKVQYVEHQVLA